MPTIKERVELPRSGCLSLVLVGLLGLPLLRWGARRRGGRDA